MIPNRAKVKNNVGVAKTGTLRGGDTGGGWGKVPSDLEKETEFQNPCTTGVAKNGPWGTFEEALDERQKKKGGESAPGTDVA